MSEFVVKSDGWLYKEGVKVALEFGNVEQIKAIRAYEKKMKSYAEGTIRPLISYETKGNVFFNCIFYILKATPNPILIVRHCLFIFLYGF